MTELTFATTGTWVLTSCLLGAGLFGSMVPFLPGPLLIVVAAVTHHLLLPASGMSWYGIGLLLLLMVLAYALDVASGVLGTRWYGGSRWGMLGVICGGVVGLFFGLPGLILGPLLGGLTFELLVAKRDMQSSVRGVWGTVVGSGMGLVARVVIATIMIALFFWDVFWWN